MRYDIPSGCGALTEVIPYSVCFECRPSPWVTPASAPCLRRRSGTGSIIRKLLVVVNGRRPGKLTLLLPRYDLQFWYGSGFGSPVGRAQGIGYVQELVARLTKTPIQTVCCRYFCLRSVNRTSLSSTTLPLIRHWMVTRSPSPWTDVLCMSTPLTKSPS